MWTYISSWFSPTFLFLLLNIVVGTIFIISRFGSDRGPHHQHDFLSTATSPRLARAPSLLERVRSINFSVYKFEHPESEPHVQTLAVPNPLARAPSLLERLTSIEFHSLYRSGQIHQDTEFNTQKDSDANVIPEGPATLSRAPSLLERVKSINLSSFYRPDPTNQEPEITPETDVDNQDLVQDPSPYNDNHSHHESRSKSETRVAANPSKQAEHMKKSARGNLKTAVLDDEGEEIESIEKRRPATMIEKMVSIGDVEVDAKADDFITRFKQQLRLQRLDSLLRHKEKLKGK